MNRYISKSYTTTKNTTIYKAGAAVVSAITSYIAKIRILLKLVRKVDNFNIIQLSSAILYAEFHVIFIEIMQPLAYKFFSYFSCSHNG